MRVLLLHGLGNQWELYFMATPFSKGIDQRFISEKYAFELLSKFEFKQIDSTTFSTFQLS